MLRFRHGTPDDAATLAAFAAQAFRDTYRDLDEASDIDDHVAEHFTVPAVAAVLRDHDGSVLLAESGRRLAGYAVLRTVAAPACVTGPRPVELARFYLGAAFTGRGFGDPLMHAVQAEARRLGAKTLWLGVYDRNLRAIRFYERHGFRRVGGKEFRFGVRVYIDPIYAAPVPAGPVDPQTLNALAVDYTRGMTSIRGRRVQRLVRREFAGATRVLLVPLDAGGPAVLGVSEHGAACCATDGRGPHAALLAWRHGATQAVETHFDLLKDSLPALRRRDADVPDELHEVVARALDTLA